MLNIDASYDKDRVCGDTSAIIRDGSESMIAPSNTFIPYLVDAPMPEAFALKEGLMLAQYFGCNQLIVQFNCKKVIEIMENEGFTTNSSSRIYDECNIVLSGFPKISIEHLSWKANHLSSVDARF